MPFLGNTPAQGFANSVTKDDFTPNGSTTDFTLSKVATTNSIEVYVGNVRQEPTDAYSVSGTTLTMTEAPASSVNFYVMHVQGTIESATVPPAGSIVANSLASTLDLSGKTVSYGLTDSDMPAGSVIQVLYDSSTSGQATSSTSYVDTDLSLSITPISTSSKILVISNVTGIWSAAATRYLKARPIRGAVGLSEFGGASGYSGAGQSSGTVGTCQLDSPNTSSAITYKIQIASATGAAMAINNNSSLSSITLLEISV